MDLRFDYPEDFLSDPRPDRVCDSEQIEQQDLAKKLADLENRLAECLDVHETAIVEVLRQGMLLLNPPQNPSKNQTSRSVLK